MILWRWKRWPDASQCLRLGLWQKPLGQVAGCISIFKMCALLLLPNLPHKQPLQPLFLASPQPLQPLCLANPKPKLRPKLPKPKPTQKAKPRTVLQPEPAPRARQAQSPGTALAPGVLLERLATTIGSRISSSMATQTLTGSSMATLVVLKLGRNNGKITF